MFLFDFRLISKALIDTHWGKNYTSDRLKENLNPQDKGNKTLPLKVFRPALRNKKKKHTRIDGCYHYCTWNRTSVIGCLIIRAASVTWTGSVSTWLPQYSCALSLVRDLNVTATAAGPPDFPFSVGTCPRGERSQWPIVGARACSRRCGASAGAAHVSLFDLQKAARAWHTRVLFVLSSRLLDKAP